MAVIVVLGAAGTAGQRIVAEAAGRGHTVVPVVRDTTRTPEVAGVPTVAGDATSTESVAGLLDGADAARAVTAAVTTRPEPRPYVVHMGGGATLTTPDGTMFLDTPGFPGEYLLPARGQADALAFYRTDPQAAGMAWTYVSPPPVDFAPGERTGRYRTGGDQPVAGADGSARLSYEDFAVAVVEEVERRAFTGRRFTVGY